jgi:hypothetical protein
MHADLAIPYCDTDADQLTWRLGDPPGPALATLQLEISGGRLELRLLGSSHHVVFSAGSTRCSEVVACGPAEPALPASADRALPGWDYRFRSRVHRLPADRFAAMVDRLVDRLADHPSAIVGRFPGSPHAVTALLAAPVNGGRGVRWRTWHAYPQDGQLVATGTRLTRGPVEPPRAGRR